MDVFKQYGVSNLMDHMFLATHPDYYRIGIGLQTVAATAKLAEALHKGEDVLVPISEDKYPWKKIPAPRSEIVIALFTSPKSQKIGSKLGWEETSVVSYEDLFYEGKSYASRLDKSNNCSVFMVTKVNGK